MDPEARFWRYLVRGLQGLVMMMEEHRKEIGSMDDTTRQNLDHWRQRLSKIDAVETTQGNEPAPAAPPEPRRRRNLPG